MWLFSIVFHYLVLFVIVCVQLWRTVVVCGCAEVYRDHKLYVRFQYVFFSPWRLNMGTVVFSPKTAPEVQKKTPKAFFF